MIVKGVGGGRDEGDGFLHLGAVDVAPVARVASWGWGGGDNVGK